MKLALVVSTVALLALGGCGRDSGTRALTGGGIGVLGAAVIGAPLVAGAAVGAITGAATTPRNRDVNEPDEEDDAD